MAEPAKTPTTQGTKDITAARPRGWSPFESFRDEMDRLFEDFSRGFPSVPAWRRMSGGATMPAVDIVEKGDGFTVTAELPGMNEGDIDVKVADGVLTINGEKKEEREENEKGYHLSERRYGAFMRSFGLPEDVEADKIDARFKNGVLTVVLPRSAGAKASEKKIDVKAA
ncbi:MAG: Hsp20/alpha crystallin family protein [Hyphomicrobiales bacterium]|nr:Hsp20/alpha crystallin family protein [Hyphomicrobiales bacterium]